MDTMSRSRSKQSSASGTTSVIETDRDSSRLSLSDCELHGYYGDTLKCCPSQSSLVSDSGLSSYEGLSQCSSASSLLQFDVRGNDYSQATTAVPQTQNTGPIKDVPSHPPKRSPRNPSASVFIQLLGYLCWIILTIFGLFRQKLLQLRLETNNQAQELYKQRHFVPLYNYWENIFTQFIYRRLRDILNRPISSRPSAVMQLKDRVSHDHNWTFEYPGTSTTVINMGSYNYLGFSESARCTQGALTALTHSGVGIGSTAHELGSNRIHKELEQKVASFLGVEDAFCCPMGFGTNTMNLPALVGAEALVLSDELNHASLILGCRMSQALTKVFKHNDVGDCERRIIEGLRHGNPNTGRAYSAILIVVEGLYSMEGTIVHLADFVALKNKYKAYLFLDEAHSIGSLGRTGRGVAEYWGVPHTEVDVLMGTFTKSFSAAGGYVAGKRAMIERIRALSYTAYASTMAPCVAAQIINAFDVLTGADGTNQGERRLAQLRCNTRYFRRRLKQAGFHLYGNSDSPVVPALVYFPSKVAVLSREMLKRKIGIVAVGFPATPIATERARFCLSSAHTIEQLDYVVNNMTVVADMICARPAAARHNP